MMWFPLSARCRRGIICGIFVLLLGWSGRLVYIATHWPEYCEQYGPMSYHSSQCLVCQRLRDEKWVCGAKVRDTITTNEYSDWVDSFVSKEHDHDWLISTRFTRSDWFGIESLGCGGIPTIAEIHRMRERIGEDSAKRLIIEYHKLVRARDENTPLKSLDEFLNVVIKDPKSLLQVNE